MHVMKSRLKTQNIYKNKDILNPNALKLSIKGLKSKTHKNVNHVLEKYNITIEFIKVWTSPTMTNLFWYGCNA